MTYGDGTIDVWGYRWIYKPAHIQATKNGYVKEHRMVMSDVLGRKLDTTEKVHHKNGDKLDNRIENLELLSQVEHIAEHRKQLRKAYTDKFTTKWAWKFDKCIDCGTTDRRHVSGGRCVNCYHSNWGKNNRDKKNVYLRNWRAKQ